MSFTNVYDDAQRAEAYATLEFPGTYWLAFRDLPGIIERHVRGRTALDFGCGTGRSTRFLQQLGFEAVGIDISAKMIELAAAADPNGTYLRVDDGEYGALDGRRFDLVLAAFPFDNIPGVENRGRVLGGLRDLLAAGGRVVILGSTPDVYLHEWASFTTSEFVQENRKARSGEAVRIVMKDVTDARPVVDTVWFHDDYLRLFGAAGLTLEAEYRPLGRADEGQDWVSETSIAPWVIYVARR